jgi:hypothetical protein
MIYDDYSQLIRYLKLSQAYRQRSMLSEGHRALLLASVYAHQSGCTAIANYCQRQILQANPGHVLRKFDNLQAALADPDFTYFVNQLRKKIPLEKVDLLLANLGYCFEQQRSDYSSDNEFAAAILGVEAGWIEQVFGE